MSVLYDTDEAVRKIVFPADGSPGLDPSRGAHRQEGSSGHLFRGERDAGHRVGKVDGRALAGMSAAEMAATLRRAVDGSCVMRGRDYGCRSHLAFVDEITATYHDGAPNPRARRPSPVPKGGAGARLSRAMRTLAVPSPYGGTYADRIHFYVAPSMVSSMAAGRGPLRNLGRDGRQHFATWRAVMPGLARAGGVWLEMYHYRGGRRTAFTGREWRVGPRAFSKFFARADGDRERVHFMLSAVSRPRGRLPACRGAMSCQWALADLSGTNRSILANGVGAYRVGDQASAWLREHNRRFPS